MSNSTPPTPKTWEEVIGELKALVTSQSKSAEFKEALNDLRNKGELLAHETVPEHKDRRNELLGLTIRYQNVQALEILMDFFNLSTLPEDSSTPNESADLLCLAVTYYHEPTFRYVLAHIDADQALRHSEQRQQSVLHVAADAGIKEVFRILYEAKGDDMKRKILDARDSKQQTALHVAVSKNRLETVVELIRIQPELIKVQDANGQTVFHKAVTTNKEILECLLASNPEVLAQCDALGNSPYTYLLDEREFTTAYTTLGQVEGNIDQTESLNDSIGSMLFQAILKLENVSALDKRKLLFKDRPDLQCDLSMFDAENLDFPEYLDDLKKDRLNIEFYKTLIRVKLPDLSCSPKKACTATLTHPVRNDSEANLIFDYLSRKGVQRVIEAVIPDCIVHPHSNRNIINALKPMGVKRLNWRKLNLGVSTIQMAAPEVEDLTLYSSGDADALLQLTGPNGLCKLRKLKQIHVIISRGEDDDDELERLRKRCEDDLALLKKDKIRVTLADLVSADEQADNAPPPLVQRHQGQSSILENLSPFRNLLRTHYGPLSKQKIPKGEFIKVAILDSGVYANRSIFPNLTGGSFVEDTATADCHWHTVTNSHGTKMASLISEVNPYCHFYAARTHFGTDMHGGDVYSLSKALEWATDQSVDIICISWTGPETIELQEKTDLEAKIKKASVKSLIFCATGDKGPVAKKSFPAGFAETFSISNCTMIGNHLEHTELDNTEFLVPALDLVVNVPKYIKKEGKDTAEGSSAATAVAAGLASLVLSLVWFASSGTKSPEEVSNREKQIVNFKSRSVMESVFQHMCGTSKKFVQPWKVLPRDVLDKGLDDAKIRVKEFLDKATK